MAAKKYCSAIAQQVCELHTLSVALDGLDVRIEGQRMAYQLRTFLTHRFQRPRENAHEDSVARVDMHHRLDLRVRFVKTGVNLHFGALRQSRTPGDEESLGIAHDHVV